MPQSLRRGAVTLHIWHEKIYPDQKLSPEISRHKDQFDAIPPSVCFDFAQLHWKKVGQKLLIAINEDLRLHLEDGYCSYGPKDIQTAAAHDAKLVRFSFFKAPVTNTIPHKAIILVNAYNYIRGDYALKETAELRGFTDLKRGHLYKRTHFHYCTFSGTFSSRADNALTEHSDLLCVDFDHIREWQALHVARILLEHIIGVYNSLPHVSTPVKATADARTFSKQKFWSDLPQEFDTQTFLQAASALAIAPKTTEKYITAWCKAGQLFRIAQGKYEKA